MTPDDAARFDAHEVYGMCAATERAEVEQREAEEAEWAKWVGEGWA